MAKSPPSHAVRLTTFADLEPYVRAFGEGHLNLLMIFGPPGVGKSRSVRQALGSQVCWIGGQATPFGIYLQAYEHRNKPIVLDDVDGLYADRLGVRLLKALGQTERTKTLSWQTAAPTLARSGIPRQFTTTSRVALVGNDWKTLNADVAALEDRGHLLLFEPTPLEVHSQAASWFWDQEIFDFIADHLHLMAQHSLRTYGHAWELKRSRVELAARGAVPLSDRRRSGRGQAEGRSGLCQRRRARPDVCAIGCWMPGKLFPACAEAAASGKTTEDPAYSDESACGRSVD
jgi:hypothetical protein